MPSPIAHVAAGYVVYRLFRRHRLGNTADDVRVDRSLLAATVVLSLLPDLDSALGIAMGDLGLFHNQVTHSLVVGACIALVAGVLAVLAGMRQLATSAGQARSLAARRPLRWLVIVLACYSLHVVMDYFTVGRGVMALWPLTAKRYLAPVTVFAGLHWSDGLWSLRHLGTAATEIALICGLGLVYVLLARR